MISLVETPRHVLAAHNLINSLASKIRDLENKLLRIFHYLSGKVKLTLISLPWKLFPRIIVVKVGCFFIQREAVGRRRENQRVVAE